MGNECLLDDQLEYDCLVFILTGHLVQKQQNMISAGCYTHHFDCASMLAALSYTRKLFMSWWQ